MFGGRTVFEGGAIKVIEDEESDGEETSAPLADPGSEDDEIRCVVRRSVISILGQLF